MEQWYGGGYLAIWLLPGCRTSWEEAEGRVPGNQSACPNQFRARLKQLAEVGRLRNPDLMNSEGNGIQAVKASCGLRAYGWFCHVNGARAFVISHVVLKRENRADPADIAKAARAKEALEIEQAQQKKEQEPNRKCNRNRGRRNEQ